MNNQIRPTNGRQILNPAKPSPISSTAARAISNAEIWRREFISDFDQILKSVSNAETGLRYGSPAPTVT